MSQESLCTAKGESINGPGHMVRKAKHIAPVPSASIYYSLILFTPPTMAQGLNTDNCEVSVGSYVCQYF